MRDFWSGRRVLVTGHTGFKGGWLALWLADMGAEVHGFALPPDQSGGVYCAAGVGARLAGETFADLADAVALDKALCLAQPEIVFHLAAQPLVRASYRNPAATFATNVTGLVTLLEALRDVPGLRAVVNVTSDKCYENREWDWPYREDDPIGGYDPYSASKACAEIVTAAWRQSFLSAAGISLASARAGNVIGGGDLAADRLLPDLLRARAEGQQIVLRNPAATRPWQHVLEPLAGYMILASALVDQGAAYARAWNFGPDAADVASVREVVEQAGAQLGGSGWRLAEGVTLHEAQSLTLDSAAARRRLGWRPRWQLDTALARTLDWHRAQEAGADMAAFTLSQIAEYEAVIETAVAA